MADSRKLCIKDLTRQYHLYVNKYLIKLEDRRPIRCFLLALAEGPLGPIVTVRQNHLKQGAND